MTTPLNSQSQSTNPCCCDSARQGDSGNCNNTDMPWREFVKLVAAGTAARISNRAMPVMAGPFPRGNKYLQVIPQDKPLDPDWVRSLYERGEKQTYSGDDLRFIGMPIGGIGAGVVYLGGDGRL